MNTCPVCDQGNLKEIYYGRIREGQYGNWSAEPYTIYQCSHCKTIWHESRDDNKDLYESDLYRVRLDGDAEIETYYAHHDKDTLMKLEWCKSAFFRDKIVADVGCGGGSFLDSISGAARKVIAIEPTLHYHDSLYKKGYDVFSYAHKANLKYKNQVDVVTSFDVIEHVDDPITFANEIYNLLKDGGRIIIGTPTDYPHLRYLLGRKFDEFIFSVQHPWVFSKEGLYCIFKKSGFTDIKIEYKQVFALGNTISWCLEQRPCGHINYDFITPAMNAVYREEMIRTKQSDYLVLYAQK